MRGKFALGLVAALGVLAVLAAYCLWPAGATTYWAPSDLLQTPAPKVHAHALDKVQRLAVGLGRRPVALMPERPGSIYGGSVVVAYADGRIVRLSADGRHYELLGNTLGRPFAVATSLNGGLFVADARRGLLAVGEHHQVRVLYAGSGIEGVAVSADGGKLYFTHWSSHFSWQQVGAARFAHDSSGRLMVYDTGTRRVHTVASGLTLPRGVALGPNDDYALVAESGRYRIVRVWLHGPNAGKVETFASGLPGFPAGISFDGFKRFWVAIPTQRMPTLDALAQRSIYRRFLLRLPRAFMPRLHPVHTPCVLAFDLAGQRVAELRGTGAEAYGPVSVAAASGAWLWLASDAHNAVARVGLRGLIEDAPAPPQGWRRAPRKADQVTPGGHG